MALTFGVCSVTREGEAGVSRTKTKVVCGHLCEVTCWFYKELMSKCKVELGISSPLASGEKMESKAVVGKGTLD